MTDTNANTIAGQLTDRERRILGNLSDLNFGAVESWTRLRDLGLIEPNKHGGNYWAHTDLGAQVLAALPTQTANGGGVVVITAAKLVEQDYLAKINAGICEVFNADGYKIIHRGKDMWGQYHLCHYFDGEKYKGKLYAWDDEFTVQWLPPPATAPQPASAIPEAVANKIINRLRELKHDYDTSKLTSYGKDNLIACAGEMLFARDNIEQLADLQAQLASAAAENGRLEIALGAARTAMRATLTHIEAMWKPDHKAVLIDDLGQIMRSLTYIESRLRGQLSEPAQVSANPRSGDEGREA